MTSSEKPRRFCKKSQLISIARGLSIKNQKLGDILFQPLTRKHEIRGDTFSNRNIIMCSFKSSGDIQRKRVGQTAVSDNQSSSVTLNELAKKDKIIYCNFEFQRRSHSMTEMNPNRAQITKTV